MSPREDSWHWWALLGAALVLCLALFGTGANASMDFTQENGVMVASTMDAGSMPSASDCLPCALCYVAPAPVAQGVSGECEEPREPGWQVHTPPMPETAYSGTGRQPFRLPVRIAYCRWLN